MKSSGGDGVGGGGFRTVQCAHGGGDGGGSESSIEN